MVEFGFQSDSYSQHEFYLELSKLKLGWGNISSSTKTYLKYLLRYLIEVSTNQEAKNTFLKLRFP